jgi:hypothetical protein
MMRAFVRGRGSSNLYAMDVDAALLEQPVAAVGAALGVRSALAGSALWHASVPFWTRGLDGVAFVVWCVVAMVYVAAVLPLIIGLMVAGVVVALRQSMVCCPARLMAA